MVNQEDTSHKKGAPQSTFLRNDKNQDLDWLYTGPG